MQSTHSASNQSALSTPRVFFTPVPVPSIIDLVVTRGGIEVGMYSNETLAQLQLKNPEASLSDEVSVTTAQEAALTTNAAEITAEQYHDALEALPPVDFVRFGRTTSFKFAEHLRGRITTVYCHMYGRYFSFNDVRSIAHDAILAKVRKTFSV